MKQSDETPLEIRTFMGLTQTEFGKLLNISPSYLSKLEREREPITPQIRQRLGLLFLGPNRIDLAAFLKWLPKYRKTVKDAKALRIL